ncbi:MAG: 1-deoxy-D-xylulose-5-phosphate reductoisomerase [Clostridiales bacterium]|nr:1-deoxy-D-xylulose-5-phosphate reductoisomerase [Clostridiales bacterium]
MKNISILGSTGSIGTQALEVCRNLGFKVSAITANKRIDLLEKQINEFKPEIAVVMDEEKAIELKKRINGGKTEILAGIDGINRAADIESADIVLNSLVGNIGLEPTLTAIRKGKNIALANKETLVSAGELVMREAKKFDVKIFPVDSEHSAIFQCLRGNEENKISKIHLTASGGPFRDYKSFDGITVAEALNHPNWSMGKKITVDSATMMNKGLEVIEAKWLFDIKSEKINVVVHPQSVIHSMVEFEDGAVIAQLGEPDMRVPIQYAFTFPKRVKNDFPKIDFFKYGELTFKKPNIKLFKCLSLAFDAIKTGGTLPAVLNGANEIAVDAFLNKKIEFSNIHKLIEKAMNAYNIKYNYDFDDVFDADLWARNFTKECLKTL